MAVRTGTFADLGDAVEFAVADDGLGIAPEYHDRVFELFRTLKPRDQVEGNGANFTFTWPRVR